MNASTIRYPLSMMTTTYSDRLWPAALDSLAATIGNDPSLTQGPGGNVSYKDKSHLWIKASGTQMSRAVEEEIFIGLSIQDDLFDSNKFLTEYPIFYRANSKHLPSIETIMHLIIRYPYVAHVHSIESVAASIVLNPINALSFINKFLNVKYVPYCKPGKDLANSILKVIDHKTDAILLGNHGLTVWGAQASECLQKIKIIEEKFGDFHSSQNLIQAESISGVQRKLEILTSGLLVPDELIFLGKDAPNKFTIDNASKRIVFSKEFPSNDWKNSLVASLIQSAGSIPLSEQIRYLSNLEIDELIDWDAEKVRKFLDQS